MTCDKHTGEYYSIPSSHSVSRAIDSVVGCPTEPIRYTLDKIPFRINWPPRVRQHEYKLFFFGRETGSAMLFCRATENNLVLLKF